MTRADDEEALRQRVLAEVSEYLRHTRDRAGKVVFDVVVTSSWTLSDLARKEIEASVDELRAGYPDAVPRVRFAVREEPAVPPVVIVPVDSGSASSAAMPPPEGDQPDDEDLRLVALTVDGLRFVNRLPEGEWLPVYRGERRRGIELHPAVAVVPQGALFELRNSLGNLVVRRTAERPEYTVSANGTRLERSDRSGVRVGPKGTIDLRADNGRATDIGYELIDGAQDTEAATGGTGDRAPVGAWLSAGGRVYQLSIEPPVDPVPRKPRTYPITGAPGAPATVEARVGYTRARTVHAPDQHWHIKAYRCETPEDAAHLHRTLAGQALRISQANVTFGGSNIRPPWAMVPVHLLATGVVAPAATGDDDAAAAASEGARLSAWFGLPGRPQADHFVLVASPYLKPLQWSTVEDVAAEPATWFLEYLVGLATALDHCHARDLAHGDIKVDNICRAVFEDSSSGFVFIDGDSVRAVTCAAAEFRGTPTWVSKRTLRQLKAGGPVDLRAHDRFCFALVVLIAVAGQERVRDLMAGAVGQPRPVDSYDDVLGALRRAWPGPRWQAFTEELAAPFAPDVLSEKNWLTADWVARLRAALTPPPPCGHPSCTPDACTDTRPDDDTPFPGEFGREVAAIRARVRTVTTANQRRGAVLDELRAMQRIVAVARYHRILAVRVGIAVAVAGAWLVTLAVGVFG